MYRDFVNGIEEMMKKDSKKYTKPRL